MVVGKDICLPDCLGYQAQDSNRDLMSRSLNVRQSRHIMTGRTRPVSADYTHSNPRHKV